LLLLCVHAIVRRLAVEGGISPKRRCQCLSPVAPRSPPAHVRPARGPGPLRSTRRRRVGDCSTQGPSRHGGQIGPFGPAGARILPSPVNAGPGRGARRPSEGPGPPGPARVPCTGRALEGAMHTRAVRRRPWPGPAGCQCLTSNRAVPRPVGQLRCCDDVTVPGSPLSITLGVWTGFRKESPFQTRKLHFEHKTTAGSPQYLRTILLESHLF
jgi:hypothetical protein